MDYWKNKEIITREKILDKYIFNTTKNVLIKIKSNNTVADKIKLMYLESTYNNKKKDISKTLNDLIPTMFDEINILGSSMKRCYKDIRKVITDIPVDEDIIDAILLSAWVNDNKNYIDRIKYNTATAMANIYEDFNDYISAGRSYSEFEEKLFRDFKKSESSMIKLIETELAHIQIQSTLDAYIAEGYTEYRYITAKDEKVCEVCNSLDNMIFKISDAEVGVNLPPMHPRCRCQILKI